MAIKSSLTGQIAHLTGDLDSDRKESVQGRFQSFFLSWKISYKDF